MSRFSRGALALLIVVALVIPLVVVGCRSGASIELGFMGASVKLQLAGPDPAALKPIVTVQHPPDPAPPVDATPDPAKSSPQ